VTLCISQELRGVLSAESTFVRKPLWAPFSQKTGEKSGDDHPDLAKQPSPLGGNQKAIEA